MRRRLFLSIRRRRRDIVTGIGSRISATLSSHRNDANIAIISHRVERLKPQVLVVRIHREGMRYGIGREIIVGKPALAPL